MPAKKPSTTPDDLGTAGVELWESIAGPGKYVLRPDERATLHGAARAADMIEALRASWAESGKPMLTTGSMGQDVIHPLIGELRTQEAQKAALLARLKLPEDATGAQGVTNQHRDAANSKWSVPGAGRGA